MKKIFMQRVTVFIGSLLRQYFPGMHFSAPLKQNDIGVRLFKMEVVDMNHGWSE
jgi:hypothetical protein